MNLIRSSAETQSFARARCEPESIVLRADQVIR